MQTLVYLFDGTTGEFVSPYSCQESPLEKGVLIRPEHSTDIKPPKAGAGQFPVFANGAWSLVEDHRGAIIYEQATGTKNVLWNLGPVPSGWSLTPPPPTPEEQAAIDAKIAQEAKDAADVAAAKSYAKLDALKKMSPAQVQTWVAANVTNLAQAQDAIATLAIAVSVLARRL